MKIVKFNDFVINEKMGVATPSVMYADLIYKKVEDSFVEFKKSSEISLEDRIEVKYRDIKPYITDKEEYAKFPVVGITINVNFDKLKISDFNKKFWNVKEKKKKHALGGWASNFGNRNWKNYSKKVEPIKMVTDHGIVIDLGIDISITDDYNIGSYKSKFDDDLGRVIWHELNHLYEDYNRMFSMKGPIHRRRANIALSFTDENRWKIKKEIFDFWYSDLIYYIYASEPYEINAQVQEIGHFIQKYGLEKIKNSQSYQNADYMQNFDSVEFLEKLELLISNFYPDSVEEIKQRLKNMWISNYEKSIKEFGERPMVNISYLKNATCDEFVNYFGKRLNELGENFKRKLLKTATNYQKI